MAVDVEALLANFLRGQSAITDVTGDRVYTDLPHKREYPLILITRTGGGYIYRHHLDAAEVTFDVFGGTHKLAQSLAGTCMSTLAAALVGAHDEGVVTRISSDAIAYNPEPDSADASGHARPRYTVSAVVTVHP